MAELAELYELANDQALIERCAMAVLITADSIVERADSATEVEKKWAADVFADPVRAGRLALRAVLARNAKSAIDSVKTLDDIALQSAVDRMLKVHVASTQTA